MAFAPHLPFGCEAQRPYLDQREESVTFASIERFESLRRGLQGPLHRFVQALARLLVDRNTACVTDWVVVAAADGWHHFGGRAEVERHDLCV